MHIIAAASSLDPHAAPPRSSVQSTAALQRQSSTETAREDPFRPAPVSAGWHPPLCFAKHHFSSLAGGLLSVGKAPLARWRAGVSAFRAQFPRVFVALAVLRYVTSVGGGELRAASSERRGPAALSLYALPMEKSRRAPGRALAASCNTESCSRVCFVFASCIYITR